jgi:hypothetical protein
MYMPGHLEIAETKQNLAEILKRQDRLKEAKQ